MLSTTLFSCSKESATLNTTTQPPTSVAYSAMDVTSVKITLMPFKDASNSTWDASIIDNPAPDVYFTFNDANAGYASIFTSKTFWNVTASQLPITFTFATPFQIPDFNGSYAITLYDYDSNLSLSSSHAADDLIDGINKLSPSNLVSQGYPATTIITSTDGKFSATIGLHWHN